MRKLMPTMAILCFTTSASAHALLEHAQPGAGATVPAPRVIILTYSEQLEPAFSGASVDDAGGHDVTSAPAAISGATMQIHLHALKPGTYRVTWHAVSTDTHRTEGSYNFTVAP